MNAEKNNHGFTLKNTDRPFEQQSKKGCVSFGRDGEHLGLRSDQFIAFIFGTLVLCSCVVSPYFERKPKAYTWGQA
jgi:hypothetical protein